MTLIGRFWVTPEGRTGDFSNSMAEDDALSQNLIVENKVVRVFEDGYFQKHLFIESVKTGVIFEEYCPSKKD
jgi:hypothetical protein